MTTPSSPYRWVVRADRRSVNFDRLQSELRELGDSFQDLSVELLDRGAFEDGQDQGAYRDWGPVAVATASDPRILEALAEELILEFGFQIDMFKPEAT